MSENAIDLIETAKKLAPAIQERAWWVDENRRLHPDTIQELVDSGLTRAFQSKLHGGLEANPAEFYQACVEVAKACTSSGWILTLLGVHSWEIAHMGAEVNQDIFGVDPTVLIASSYAAQGNWAERVPGGFKLSGDWKSASGILHAEWVVLGAKVHDTRADGTVVDDTYFFLLPKSQVSLRDDWFVSGLTGTGSQSVIVDDVFVPEHRTIEHDIIRSGYGPGTRINHGPLFQMPQGYIYGSVASAPSLGVGWRFYEEYKASYGVAKTVDRSLMGDRMMMGRLAEARGKLASLDIVPVHRISEAFNAVSRGEELTDLQIAQGMYDIARNGSQVFEMAASLYPTLRPSAVYKRNIMERLYRDIIVARQHGTSSLDERCEPLAAADLGAASNHHFLITPERRAAALERARELGYVD